MSNEKALKGALGLDIFLVVLFAGGFCLYIMIMRLSFKRQVRQAADYLRRINQGDYRLVMSVTVYMKRIRGKLGDDVIKTVKGIGYRVDSDEAL